MQTPAEQYRALVNRLEAIQEDSPITVSGGSALDATGTKHGLGGQLDNTAKEYIITFPDRKSTKGATVNVNRREVPVLAMPGDNLNNITGTPITVLSHPNATEKYHRGILDASGQVTMAQRDLDSLRIESTLHMGM
jgi:hypothetical protein